jgi:hypothetical protein
MMNAGEVDIKESILLTKQEYSVLKEEIKDDECGWSDKLELVGLERVGIAWHHFRTHHLSTMQTQTK